MLDTLFRQQFYSQERSLYIHFIFRKPSQKIVNFLISGVLAGRLFKLFLPIHWKAIELTEMTVNY